MTEAIAQYYAAVYYTTTDSNVLHNLPVFQVSVETYGGVDMTAEIAARKALSVVFPVIDRAESITGVKVFTYPVDTQRGYRYSRVDWDRATRESTYSLV